MLVWFAGWLIGLFTDKGKKYIVIISEEGKEGFGRDLEC